MGVDLKKEIKLSDLFARKAKEPKPPKEPKERKDGSTPRQAPPPLPATPLMRAFNLMPSQETRERRSLGLAQVAVALLGLLVFAGLAGGFLLLSAGASERRSEVDDLRAQLAELEVPAPKQREDGDAALAGESRARTAALAAALAGRVAWDRVLRQFSLVLPEDVWLAGITAGSAAAPATAPPTVPPAEAAAAPPGSFSIVGFAESQEDVALLLSRLEVIPEFPSVRLESSTRGEQDGETSYSFTITATVDAQGAA
jgi:Tfp pilus assembly protein PilN